MALENSDLTDINIYHLLTESRLENQSEKKFVFCNKETQSCIKWHFMRGVSCAYKLQIRDCVLCLCKFVLSSVSQTKRTLTSTVLIIGCYLFN